MYICIMYIFKHVYEYIDISVHEICIDILCRKCVASWSDPYHSWLSQQLQARNEHLIQSRLSKY